MLRLCGALILFLSWLLVPVPPAAAELRAGAAVADITPKLGVSLDGPISQNGRVTGIHDPLRARALVLADDELTLAIVIVDNTLIARDVFDAAKRQVTTALGLPAEQQLMAATHTHATPRGNHIGTGPLDVEYHELLAQQIAQAVIAAHKNLAPAKIGWGGFDAPEMLACRRYLCKPGTVRNRLNRPDERIKSVAATSTGVLKPAGPIDPEFSILSVRHSDGRPLALLGNFSVHYCGGYARGQVSADYFGYFSEGIAQRLGSGEQQPPPVGLMSNGTSGDTGSFQLRKKKKYKPFEQMQEIAATLVDRAAKAEAGVTYHANPRLAMRQTELPLGVRRPTPERIAEAKAVWAKAQARGGRLTWPEVYAREALRLAEMPAETTILIQAIRIGELGIVAIPCEVFAETGLAIKAGSPMADTFTIELANGAAGYLPTARQHQLGGYETWPARSSRLEVDAETKIRAAALKLLGEVAP